ncbi:hypothetical protein [Fodinicurvata fenggangensis]|uniref:hypothetical protein n=1 Tax=Fodinicurvata fenggangensis TaxID=1121830 RepID=UPI0012DE1A55|nr:hypothetical protein [Fodinicurvata fenggangensis]
MHLEWAALVSAGQDQFAGFGQTVGHPLHHVTACAPQRPLFAAEIDQLWQQRAVQRQLKVGRALDADTEQGIESQGDDQRHHQ